MSYPTPDSLADHRPPFVVDYIHEGRSYTFHLEGPENWVDAERHLRSLKRTSVVVGSCLDIHRTNILTLWIDGFAAWLKATWRNWRRK